MDSKTILSFVKAASVIAGSVMLIADRDLEALTLFVVAIYFQGELKN